MNFSKSNLFQLTILDFKVYPHIVNLLKNENLSFDPRRDRVETETISAREDADNGRTKPS